MWAPFASEGAPIHKLNEFCTLAKLLIIFSQNLPGNNSTIWSCFCHIKLPQRKFCTKDQFLSWTKFLELLHPTHPLKIHKPFGSTYFPGVPKLVSPACVYNMNKDKNRVAQFYTKIDLSKLKSNFFGSVFDFGRPTGSFFTLYKYLWIVKEYKLIFLIFLSLSFWNITIMGCECAHPQFGAFAQKTFRFYRCTGYWTQS